MKKKILYLFSDTGGGHRASATAIMKAVEHIKGKEVHQEMADVFAECSGFLNIFAKLYAPVIKYVPKFWGMLWYWLDDLEKLQNLEKLARPFIRRELEDLLIEKEPNVVVSVHPMINHLTIRAMKDTGYKVPMITVITDPVTFHRVWVCEEVDALVVANEIALARAVEYDMPKQKIHALGIPIDPKFLLSHSKKEELRQEIDLEPKLFTVLLMGGGEGSGKMNDIILALNRSRLKIQLIVICGKNKRLFMRLEREKGRFYIPIRIYGFTDAVHELMAESDLLITKAGPGTIAEALAMDLPMIITSWLPGQEEGNVQFVIDEDIGRVSKEPDEVVEIIKNIQETGEYEKMKKNIERVRRPHASFDIAKLILSYL